MATSIKSTELDFDTIKSRLKDYLRAQDEFQDYDFEGSGLSNILDVLAYNTHFNGLLANFALNESFLNTAQLRSSMVSHAEALGYIPRSYTSSKALVNLSLSITALTRPTSIALPRGTTFTTTVAGESFTFSTLETYSATDDGSGVYNFVTRAAETAIPIYEGVTKTKTFFVGETDESQVYVIPDITADTESLQVRVYDTAGSSSFESYTNLKNAVRVTSDSTYYQIKEVPNGYYEVLFGDGVSTGKRPSAGNKIIITYLSTVGPRADGAQTFTPSADLTIDGVDYPITVTTEAVSSNGTLKESIESIRQTAPIAFASQKRMVVAEDYKAQILANYSAYLDDVIAWSGADNDPVVYGKVYVGLKFKDSIADDTQAEVKNDIVNNLSQNFAVMSIDTDFTDPVETYLELQINFNLDPDLTDRTPRATETLVKNLVEDYVNTNLKRFGKVFRRSLILTLIDDLDQAILNSRMAVKVQQRFIPVIGQSLSYTINFPVALATPDDVNRIITSGRFTYDGEQCKIQNRLNSNKLEIVNLDGTIKVDNIGEYNDTTGRILIEGFNPSAVIGGTELKISATPVNQSTIRPLRNYILDIDSEVLEATAQIDYQETRLTL